MTPDQTAALLAYAAAIDPRIRRNDPDERRLQAAAWHTQLRHIDPDPARRAVDAHYARPRADAALPGDIRHGAQAFTEPTRLPQLPPVPEVPSLAVQANKARLYRLIATIAAKRAVPGDDQPTTREAAG
jgi:hypothetical protein